MFNGAIAIICTQEQQALQVPQFIVKDSIVALTNIANYHRNNITCPIIGVTGSNGKTSVKELIRAILPTPSLATRGNFNNHIGVPLSLLQLNQQHRYAVFELGANHPGEILHSAKLVKPHVALINNIGPAHIGKFGSLETIAKTKGEIYQNLTASGTAIVNADDKFSNFWDNILKKHTVLRFSYKKPADVYAENISLNSKNYPQFELILPNNRACITLKVKGEHMIANALAAAAASFALQIPFENIVNGLINFTGVTGRMHFLQGKNNSTIIDDSYNANLQSTLVAIKVLATCPGKRILVLGDLHELGSFTQQHHEEIGNAAHAQGIELLMTLGETSKYSSMRFGTNAKHYYTKHELIDDLLPQLDTNITVLIKGSRASAMEKIVDHLTI